MTIQINTQINTEQIARLLTQSAEQLNEPTVYALASARRNALQRQSSRSPVFMLAPARWVTAGMAAGVLMVMLVGTGSYLHHEQQDQAREQQISDLDVAILTDELPIEVFVD